MALAAGSSSMLCNEPTLHTRTAIAVVQQLLPHAQFSISTQPARADGKQLYMIQCQGAGLQL
jgi:RNA 3'-terminal phosphate cyclase (ATP)